MKLKKMMALVCFSTLLLSSNVFASTPTYNVENEAVMPLIDETHSVTLVQDEWVEITSDNNFWPERVTVAIDSWGGSTVSKVVIRLTYKTDKTESFTLTKTHTSDKFEVPAFSGKYKLEAKALDGNGTVTFNVYD